MHKCRNKEAQDIKSEVSVPRQSLFIPPSLTSKPICTYISSFVPLSLSLDPSVSPPKPQALNLQILYYKSILGLAEHAC